MKKLVKRIKGWYQGEYIPPTDEKKINGVEFVWLGDYKRSISAKIVRILIEFWLDNWKILFPVIVMSTITLYIYFDSKPNVVGRIDQKSQNIISSNHI